MKDMFSDLWGYISIPCIFAFDHWSGIAAGVLFVLQVIFQVYRIKQVRKEESKEV